jgi:cytochrome c-type biogenesis protein CcmH/NrfG
LLLGNLYYYMGQWEEAVAAYERTIKLEPRLSLARSALASAREQADTGQP